MPFLPIVNIAKVKKLTDEPKFATVIDNDDPKQLGRVKVKLPGVFDGTTDQLPWIRRKMDTLFCGDSCEIFDVPEVGSIVEIRWSYDESTPVYTGAPYNQKHKSNAFTGNYPHEGGFKFGDNIIKFDKASQSITIENAKIQIVLDPMGGLNIACKTVDIHSSMNIMLHGDVTVNGNLHVTGDISSGNGADGLIHMGSIAGVSGGIVTSIGGTAS